MGKRIETSSHGIWPSFLDVTPGTRTSARSSTFRVIEFNFNFNSFEKKFTSESNKNIKNILVCQ